MSTISVSFQSSLINPANQYVAAAYDMSNLIVPVETFPITKGAGYPPTFQITFLNSYTANKFYRVILWENTSAVAGGTSRCSGDIKASVNQTTLRQPLFLVYGIDAQFTDNVTINDASLIGWNIEFEQFGSGTLTPGGGNDYTFDNVTNGRIILVNGTNYVNGQKMVIHFLPQISAAPAVSSGVSTGRQIHVDTTLTSADSNSAIFMSGTAGSFITTLPALSTMTDYQPIEFYSAGGNHNYVTLLCQGTDKIQWNALRTKLFMRQATNITLFKANGVYNIKGDTTPMTMIGEILYKYTNTDFPYILADGTLINRGAYPGIFDYFQGLPGSAVTTEAAWANTSTPDGATYFLNKGLWTAGDGSTTIRVPLLINQFIRGAGGLRTPGQLQIDSMLIHTHDTVMGGTGGVYPNGKTLNETVGGDTGGVTAGGKLSGTPFNAPGAGNVGTVITRVSSETRPQNISLYALIRL